MAREGASGEEERVRLRGPAPEEEELYRLITKGIAIKQIRPGARLKEAALAAQFGVSRARVRRVLQRLAEVDVVEFKLNLGAMVSRPTPAEARNVFRTRRVLEAEAVRAVCGLARQSSVRTLRRFLETERSAFRRGATDLIELTSDFHALLAGMSGNSVLARMLEGLIHRCVLIQSLYQKPGEGTVCLTDDHIRIVDLIERGDADAAAAEMDRHFDHIEASLDYHAVMDERISAGIR